MDFCTAPFSMGIKTAVAEKLKVLKPEYNNVLNEVKELALLTERAMDSSYLPFMVVEYDKLLQHILIGALNAGKRVCTRDELAVVNNLTTHGDVLEIYNESLRTEGPLELFTWENYHSEIADKVYTRVLFDNEFHDSVCHDTRLLVGVASAMATLCHKSYFELITNKTMALVNLVLEALELSETQIKNGAERARAVWDDIFTSRWNSTAEHFGKYKENIEKNKEEFLVEAERLVKEALGNYVAPPPERRGGFVGYAYYLPSTEPEDTPREILRG